MNRETKTDYQQYPHRYLTEKEVAKITGFALSSLRNQRSIGVGIPYCKVGRSVRYSYEDVIDHLESRKIHTTDSK